MNENNEWYDQLCNEMDNVDWLRVELNNAKVKLLAKDMEIKSLRKHLSLCVALMEEEGIKFGSNSPYIDNENNPTLED